MRKMQLENFIETKMIRLFFVVLIVVSVTTTYVPGTQLRTLARATTTTIPTSCETGKRFGCTDDCTTQLVCDHASLVIGTVKCPTSSPYCDGGQCGTVPSANCSSVGSSSNLCPGTDGYYPSKY